MKLALYLGIMVSIVSFVQIASAQSFGTSGSPSALPGAPSPTLSPSTPVLPQSSNTSSPSISPPSTSSSKTITPPASQPKLSPKPALQNNLPPEFKHTENYYRQNEEIPPPAPSTYDSQEILTLIENQIAAIQQSDLAKAYTNFTASKFREVTSLEEFKYFVESFPVFSKNRYAIFGNLEFKNGVLTLQGNLTATTGETLRVEYDLVKEGPVWKIIGIKLIRPLESENNFPAPIQRKP